MTNPVTIDRRHFEDLRLGETIDLGAVTVDRDAIVGFAREFDPFPFHLDEEAARKSLLGGLAASGWQTAALSLRMLVDSFLADVAAMGGLGVEDLKWRRPLMAGDTLAGSVAVTALRRSASRPEMGIVTMTMEMRNQRGEPVMTMRLANVVEVRDPARLDPDEDAA